MNLEWKGVKIRKVVKLCFVQSQSVRNLIYSFPQNGISFADLQFYVFLFDLRN